MYAKRCRGDCAAKFHDALKKAGGLMFWFGVVLAFIGFITLVLPSFGIGFVDVGALADLLDISLAMLSTWLIVLGFAFALVGIVLGIVRMFKGRGAAKGQKEEQL